MTCTCPLGDFPVLADVTCKENFGQVQKAIFVDMDENANGVAAAPAGIVAALQALITTNKSAVITPFLEAPEQEAGEARTFGGGNDTPNGIEEFLGMGPSQFTAQMRGVPQSIIANMKQLICFAESGKLGVYLINGSGQIEGISKTVSNVQNLAPIPVRSIRISDKVHGGFDEPDRNEISWMFLPDYSDGLVIVTPTVGSGLDIVNTTA